MVHTKVNIYTHGDIPYLGGKSALSMEPHEGPLLSECLGGEWAVLGR